MISYSFDEQIIPASMDGLGELAEQLEAVPHGRLVALAVGFPILPYLASPQVHPAFVDRDESS